jgi:type I restriction enzyme S subunit
MVQLGDIFSLEYGRALRKDARDAEGSIPVAGSNGIDGWHTKALVKGPGIVVGRKGSAGKITWFDKDFWPIDTTYYVKLNIKCELRWVYHLLSYLHLDRLSIVTGVPGLNRNDAYKLSFGLPPLSEQRRIVEILDQADVLRKKRAEADAKAARILPALFYKMFGDPATNPKGWPIKTLGELSIGRPQYGANVKAIDYNPGAPRYVRITDLTDDGRLSNADIKTLDLDNWEAYRLVEGDLLFARSGATVGKTYLYQPEDGLCAYAGYLIRFKLNTTVIEPWVVFAFTQTPYYRSWVESKRRTAAQPNINGQEYASLSLPLPDRQTQQQFVCAVRKLRALHAKREQIANSIENLFSILLHRAFTGDLTAKWREAHMKELLEEMEEQAKALNLEGVL